MRQLRERGLNGRGTKFRRAEIDGHASWTRTKETSNLTRKPGCRRSPVSSKSREVDAKDGDVPGAAFPAYSMSRSVDTRVHSSAPAKSRTSRGRMKSLLEAGLGQSERELSRQTSISRRTIRNSARECRGRCLDAPLQEHFVQLGADDNSSAW